MEKRFLSLILSIVFMAAVCGNFVCTAALRENGQEIPETTQFKTDTKTAEAIEALEELQEKELHRYILKLKDSTATDLETVTDTAFASAKEAKEQAVAAMLDTKGIPAEEAYGADPKTDPYAERLRETLEAFKRDVKEPARLSLEQNAFTKQPEIRALQENKKVIELPEEVDPDTFIQEIKEELGEDIEYIQPDYELNLAEESSVTFEVSDGEITVPEAGESMEGEASFAPKETEDTEIKTEPETTEPAEETEEENQEEIKKGNNQPETIEGDRLYEIDADLSGAWSVSRGEGVVVAVIDSGVDGTHPDLSGKTTIGWDFIEDTEMAYDSPADEDYTHGTHVAGIIAKTAPDARIMPLRAFKNGRAYTSDIIEAIAYAEENGAQIVNCSFGSTGENPALKEAMEESGLTFVCAAGNNRMNLDEKPVYPAAFNLNNTISVAALNQDLGMSYFSNYGAEKVDIAAWGRDVSSTVPGGGYAEMNGSSMSAAYVSGGAALAAAVSGTAELKNRLSESADKLSCLQNKVKDCAKINFTGLVYGEKITETSSVTPEDDFDVLGYERTADEDWALYSSTENIQVAAGYEHTLVLKENGTVWSWGRNSEGELGDNTQITRSVPKQVTGLTNVVQVAAGEMFSMALKADGTVWTWGKNQNGQLGNGTSETSTFPVKSLLLSGAKKIAAGYNHALAITEDGKLYSWGCNQYGQLGQTGTSLGNDSCYPWYTGLDNVISISAGGDHTLAVTSGGDVYACGNAEFGKTGHSDVEMKKVSGLQNIVQVTAGRWFSAALDKNGNVWTWGRNEVKELGRETSSEETSVPGAISELEDIVSISAMDRHTLAVKGDGTLWAWGWNGAGQVGNGTLQNCQTPVMVMENVLVSNDTIKQTVEAGVEFSVALDGGGKVVAWGNNSAGQLGDGKVYMTNTPVLSHEMGTDVKYLSGGEENTVVLHENGQVSVFGENSCGELGRGTYGNTNIPKEAKIKELSDIVSVDAGYRHALALDGSGKVWSWGKNANGQLGNGTQWNNSATPAVIAEDIKGIAAGNTHNLAVKTDGTLLSWGDNAYGKLGETAGGVRLTPASLAELENVKAAAAGMDHSVALLEDGTVWTWGRNNRGQLGDGTLEDRSVPAQVNGLPNIVAISAKGNHTMALDETGNVWLWGDNWYRQVSTDWENDLITTPTKRMDISNIVDISAHDRESMVVKADGTVWGWGQNENGRLGSGSQFDSPAPVQMLNVAGVQAPENISLGHSIAAGFFHAAAKASDGVYSTGWNNKGQLANGRVLSKNAPYELDQAVNHFYGISFDDAYQIAPGTTKGTIINSTEAQYFKFVAPENGTYMIYSSAEKPYQMTGTLFDVNQNQLETAQGWNASYAYMDAYENPGNFVMTKTLQNKNTYYLKIEGSASYAPYTLYIKKQELTASAASTETDITVGGKWLPASDLTVNISSSGTEVTAQSLVCDGTGRFTHTFENMTPGLYQLRISAPDGQAVWQQSVYVGEISGIENAPTIPVTEATTTISANIAPGTTQHFALELPESGNYAVYSVSNDPTDLSGELRSATQESLITNDDGMGDKIIDGGSANGKDFVITKGMQGGRYYIAVTNKAESGEKAQYDLVIRALRLEAEVRGTADRIEICGKRIPGADLTITFSTAGENGTQTCTPVYGDYRSFSGIVTGITLPPSTSGNVEIVSGGEIQERLLVSFAIAGDSIQSISEIKSFEEFDHINKEPIEEGGERNYSYTAQELGDHVLKVSGTDCTVWLYSTLEDLANHNPVYYSNTGLMNRFMFAGNQYYFQVTNNTNSAGRFDLTVEKINYTMNAALTATGITVTGTTRYQETVDITLVSYGGEAYSEILQITGDENGQFYLFHAFTPKMSMYFLTCHYSKYEVITTAVYWGDRFDNPYTISEGSGSELLGQYYDDAYYNFIPQKTGKYYIYSESDAPIDLSGKLYAGASEDTFLAENEDCPGITNNNKDFLIEFDLTGGQTYYLKVNKTSDPANAIDYKIHITQEKPKPSGAIQKVNCTAGQSVYVYVTGKNITSFAGKTYMISYDPAYLNVASAHYIGSEVNGINILPDSTGIDFTVNKEIPAGMSYSGTINVVKLIALQDGETEIQLTVKTGQE